MNPTNNAHKQLISWLNERPNYEVVEDSLVFLNGTNLATFFCAWQEGDGYIEPSVVADEEVAEVVARRTSTSTWGDPIYICDLLTLLSFYSQPHQGDAMAIWPPKVAARDSPIDSSPPSPLPLASQSNHCTCCQSLTVQIQYFETQLGNLIEHDNHCHAEEKLRRVLVEREDRSHQAFASLEERFATLLSDLASNKQTSLRRLANLQRRVDAMEKTIDKHLSLPSTDDSGIISLLNQVNSRLRHLETRCPQTELGSNLPAEAPTPLDFKTLTESLSVLQSTVHELWEFVHNTDPPATTHIGSSTPTLACQIIEARGGLYSIVGSSGAKGADKGTLLSIFGLLTPLLLCVRSLRQVCLPVFYCWRSPFRGKQAFSSGGVSTPITGLSLLHRFAQPLRLLLLLSSILVISYVVDKHLYGVQDLRLSSIGDGYSIVDIYTIYREREL